MEVHLIGYSSTIIGRVCRSTLQAETYALSDGVEESMRLRAALADAHGVFLRTDWEYHTARFMRNVWMIDCNSLNDHLRNATFYEMQRQETQHRFGYVATNDLAHSRWRVTRRCRTRSARHGEMDRHKLHGGRLSY